MCGNSNPTPTPESEKKFVTREFLGNRLTEIAGRAGRVFALLPYGSHTEVIARDVLERVNQLKRDLATMHFEQPATSAQAAGIPAAEIASRLEAIQKKAWRGYLDNPYPVDQKFGDIHGDILGLREDLKNTPQATVPPPFDLTEEQERDILAAAHTPDGLADALTSLYAAMPGGSRLFHVLDVLSDVAIELRDDEAAEDDDDDDDDDEDNISEGLKEKVLNRLKGLGSTATPRQRAQSLLDALTELYDEAGWASNLETMADSLMDVAQEIVDALEKVESDSQNMEVKLILNGVEVPLKRIG